MKQVKRIGFSYDKSKLWGEVILELKNKSDVLFLREPDEVKVLRCKYGPLNMVQETGESCVGFKCEYTHIYYRGFIFYIQPSEFFPFVDENHPAPICFIAYRRIGTTRMLQLTYFMAYDGIKSLDNWIEHQTKPIKGVEPRSIDPFVSTGTLEKIDSFVEKHGGYREKTILTKDTLILATETWNEEHKVVRIICMEPDKTDDGMRKFFEVDLVSNTICG